MQTWVWILIGIAAAIVLLAIVWSLVRKRRRTKQLKQGFGPEYDRVAADAPTKREAESELRARQERREQFDIRELPPNRRDHYNARWTDVQANFVDEPDKAIARADSLIQEVMRERGYPVDDFDTRAADLSVDHPDVVDKYRAAHGIRVAQERGKATTEDMRRAVQHYRALFDVLVGARTNERVRS
jgi:hypothetical protein